jgi:hypothetical protein
VRRPCAAAPFSTTSPSGESPAVGGVPSSWFAQNVLGAVQNETALGLMKPVEALIADVPVASTRLRLPHRGRTCTA